MKSLLLCAAVIFCLHANAAPVCISGNTLASYEALGADGCTVASLTLKSFDFAVVSFGGGAVPVTDNDIIVTVQSVSEGFGLKFASTGFHVSGAGFVNYLIAFTWDPTADIRGAADILDPGTVDILTDLCVGDRFRETTCAGTPLTLHVFEGVTSKLTDSVSFAPTAILGVRNNISLNANGESAAFDAIENDVFVPEPASLFCVAAGLAIACYRRALSKTRNLILQNGSVLPGALSRHTRG